MAVLTKAQHTKFRHLLHDEALGLLQAESPHLTKNEIKLIFLTIDSWWEDNRVSLKSTIDTALGRSMSNALAKKFGRFWLQYKWGLE